MAGASSAMSSAATHAGELCVLALVHESEKGKGERVARLTAVLRKQTIEFLEVEGVPHLPVPAGTASLRSATRWS